jgi:hypothetical protein
VLTRFAFPLTLCSILTAVLLSACGRATPLAAAPVKLTLRSPVDGVRVSAGVETISGVVLPRKARVLVAGQSVSPGADGRFSASVALVPGMNLVDVIASAPHAPPAMTTIRVIRYVLITVPHVNGESPAAAIRAIRGAGLTPQVDGNSDPFAFLFPLQDQVCSQTPNAGERVVADRTVTIQLGQFCT